MNLIFSRLAAASALLAASQLLAQTNPTFTKITEGPVVTDRLEHWFGAWGDYDGDGRLDLLAFGDRDNARVYHNDDGETFSVATNGPIAGTLKHGVYDPWGDLDNDGDLDLSLVSWTGGVGVFSWNLGNGQFSQTPNGITHNIGGWADYDQDGLLDAYLACTGVGRKALWHSQGDGRLTVVTNTPVAELNANDQDPSWVDYDNDGDLDLFAPRAPATPVPTRLYRNDGGGVFVEATPEPIRSEATQCLMGAWGDFDNDGDMDLFFAGWGQLSRLYVNLGDGTFERWGGQPSLGNLGLCTAAWGDYDNDGLLDLFVSRENATNRLYRNLGDGNFEQILTGTLVSEAALNSRIPSWADYNGDGFLDLFVPNVVSRRNYLYRNDGNGNHWLKVKPIGTVSPKLAVGAKVFVTATIRGQSVRQLRQITAQTSSQELLAHFGLGDAAVVDKVEVIWPSGNIDEWSSVARNQLLTLTETVRIRPERPSVSLNGSVTMTNATVATSYQWRFEGQDIEGATGRTLTIAEAKESDDGHYSVVVTSGDVTRTNYTYLHVDTQFTKQIKGPLVEDIGCSGAATAADYSGDNLADLFVSRYAVGKPSLYRSLAAGNAYEDVGGVLLPPGTLVDAGGYWRDLDNNGWMDLLVLKFSTVLMEIEPFLNQSGGTFVSAPPFAFVRNFDVCSLDFNGDGLVDLFANALAPSKNGFYRNNGDGTHTPMTANEVGAPLTVSGQGLSAWLDFNDDGRRELYVGDHGKGRNYLFREDQPGHYQFITNTVTRDTTTAPVAAAWGDFNNDTLVDLFIASWGKACKLYTNLGDGDFASATFPRTVELCNSATAVDYDNDGFLDLFVTKIPSPNMLFRNNGDGTFTRVTRGSIVNELPLGATGAPGYDPEEEIAYGGCWFDSNNDGFLELYVVNGNDAATAQTANFFYVNNPNGNAWLRLKLVGTRSNREGAGAKILVQANYAGQSRPQRRDVAIGNCLQGHNLTHFGLGDATNVTSLTIEWPSGVRETLNNVATNQILTVVEPSIEATPQPNGSVRLQVWGDPGRPFTLKTSSDLVTWTILTTVTTKGADEAVEYVDTTPDPNQRFYRMQNAE